MKAIRNVLTLLGRNKSPQKLFEDIEKCLDLFISLESQLWGVKLKDFAHSQENLLEEINHLIYKFHSKSEKDMKKYLKTQDFQDLAAEIVLVYEDFKVLKKEVSRKETFKNTLNSLTLALMSEETYQDFEDIFLLEKQLQEVIFWQDEEFKELFKTSTELKNLAEDSKADHLYENIRRVREILAGNLDHHYLWDDERHGYSNCSNILHSIKAKVLKLKHLHLENKK